MKKQIAGIFCILAGVLSVNLFAAPDAAAHGSSDFLDEEHFWVLCEEFLGEEGLPGVHYGPNWAGQWIHGPTYECSWPEPHRCALAPASIQTVCRDGERFKEPLPGSDPVSGSFGPEPAPAEPSAAMQPEPVEPPVSAEPPVAVQLEPVESPVAAQCPHIENPNYCADTREKCEALVSDNPQEYHYKWSQGSISKQWACIRAEGPLVSAESPSEPEPTVSAEPPAEPDAAAHGTHGSLSSFSPVLLNQPGWTSDCADGTPGFWFEDRAGNVECYPAGSYEAVEAKRNEFSCPPGESLFGDGHFMEWPVKCLPEDHPHIASKDDCHAQSDIEHSHVGREYKPRLHFHIWYDDIGCGHAVRAGDHAPPFVLLPSDFPELELPVVIPPISVSLDLESAPAEPPVATPPVSVSAGTPLMRSPGAIQSLVEPVGNAASELGIQSAGYAPDVQKITPSAESRLPEYAAPAALIGALAFSQFYPDYELGSSFNYSGENGNLDWEAGMRGDFHHGSFRSYVSATQSDSRFEIESGTTYRSDSFLASYTTVEAKDYMNYAVQLSAPWQHRGWEIKPNLSSEFHYDRDENHSSSESGAGLDLEYRF